mmetsp:Transcript_58902/g.110397  ORF Transcript_58902/g.110397 Transcript_58902/m.110397 type:complete len:296 (-) Transcript_58902:1374-2261(-)
MREDTLRKSAVSLVVASILLVFGLFESGLLLWDEGSGTLHDGLEVHRDGSLIRHRKFTPVWVVQRRLTVLDVDLGLDADVIVWHRLILQLDEAVFFRRLFSIRCLQVLGNGDSDLIARHQLQPSLETICIGGDRHDLVLLLEAHKTRELFCPLVPRSRLRIHEIFSSHDICVALRIWDHEFLRDVAFKRRGSSTTPATALAHLCSRLFVAHSDAAIGRIHLRNPYLDLLVGLKSRPSHVAHHFVRHQGVQTAKTNVDKDTILPNCSDHTRNLGPDLEIIDFPCGFGASGSAFLSD